MTESTVTELRSQLEKRELVKVKVLSTGTVGSDRKALFEQLSTLTGSELVEVRGGTALFHKKRGKGPTTKTNEP